MERDKQEEDLEDFVWGVFHYLHLHIKASVFGNVYLFNYYHFIGNYHPRVFIFCLICEYPNDYNFIISSE